MDYRLGADALLDRWPGIEDDIAAVAEWFHCTQGELSFSLDEEPISRFLERIESMLKTYPNFPGDAARTKQIVAALGRGEPQRPVFVDTEDGFLLEGRHRLVAFHLAGFSSVPIAYVRRAEPNCGIGAPGPR